MENIIFNQDDEWNVSKDILRLRLEFINKEIEELNLSTDYKDKFIKSKLGSLLIKIGAVMARLKPVTTKMLSDYMLGIFGIPMSISRNNEKFNIQIDNLLAPAFSILEDYVKSDAYRLSLIKQEVSGDEILKIDGLEIPLSYNAILLHIKRMKSLPLMPNDISDIQKDFINYKRNQFSLPIQKTENEKIVNPQKKIAAKFYSLYHMILIEMGREMHFDRDSNDKYSRKAIEEFAKNKYPEISSQGFYNGVIQIDITNKISIRKNFGKEYKQIIMEISNNDAKVIEHLKRFPN